MDYDHQTCRIIYMEEPKKYILDRFQEHLRLDFETFCNRHRIDKTNNQFITFLIDQNLISFSHLQRYTVRQEFEYIAADRECRKTQIVDTIANRFRISERTIWSILKDKKPIVR